MAINVGKKFYQRAQRNSQGASMMYEVTLDEPNLLIDEEVEIKVVSSL